MDSFFLTITWLGSLYLLLPLSALSCILSIRCGRIGDAALMGISLGITIISVHVAKLIFRRPRPDFTEMLVTMPSDWSFPSAHTAQVTAVFLSLTLISFRCLPPFWAILVTLVSLIVVGAVSYSRVYLQVHYISDVLAGMALAILIVFAVQVIVPHLPWFHLK